MSDVSDHASHGECCDVDARRTGARKVYKIIDFGLGRFDEYYAADEVGVINVRRCSPYLSQCHGSVPCTHRSSNI